MSGVPNRTDPTDRIGQTGHRTGHQTGHTYEDPLGRVLVQLFFFSLCTSIAIQQTGLGLLLAFGAYTCWRKKYLPTTPLDRPLLLFYGALLLSTFLGPDPVHSLTGYRKLWLVGAFFVTYIFVNERQFAQQLMTLVITVAAVLAAYGIVQHYTGIDWGRELLGKPADLDAFWLGRQEGFRTQGLFPSGITYAHNLLFPLSLVTAFLFAPSPRWQKKVLLWLAWGVMIFALLFSLTRGVWIAYACVLIACGLVRGRRALLGAVGGMVVCGLFLLSAGDGVRERAAEVFDLEAASNVARSRIWQANLDMIQDQPLFGWGYGNYKQFRAPYYTRYPEADTDAHAHNMYLQIGAESGLVGLCAFLALIAVVLGKGWQIYTALPSEPLKSCALGILLSVLGFLIGGLTQHNFGDAEVVIVLWAVLGVLMRMEEWGEG